MHERVCIDARERKGPSISLLLALQCKPCAREEKNVEKLRRHDAVQFPVKGGSDLQRWVGPSKVCGPTHFWYFKFYVIQSLLDL